MFFLRVALISPIMGLGPLIRVLPWLAVLYTCVLWLLDPAVMKLIASTLNEWLDRPGWLNSRKILPAVAGICQYLFMLTLYRITFESAAQLGITDRRRTINIFVPGVSRLGSVMLLWLLPLGIFIFLILQPYFGSHPLHALRDPLFTGSDGGRIYAPHAILFATAALGLIYWPMFGLVGIRAAARLGQPPLFLSGFLPLLVLSLIFLVIAWFMTLLLVRAASDAITFTLGRDWQCSRGLFTLLLVAVYWSMMSAAASRIFRRKFALSMNRDSQVDVREVEKMIPWGLAAVRDNADVLKEGRTPKFMTEDGKEELGRLVRRRL